MNVNVYVTGPVTITSDPAVASALDSIEIALAQLKGFLVTELQKLQAEVAENTTVIGSAIQLLTNLHDLLVAAGTDPAALAAIRETLAANKSALAASVAANTPTP